LHKLSECWLRIVWTQQLAWQQSKQW
jgi:hypothetical protein